MTTYHVIATDFNAAKKFAAILFLQERPGNNWPDTLARVGRQPSFMANYYHPFTVMVETSPTGLKIDVLKRITGEKP